MSILLGTFQLQTINDTITAISFDEFMNNTAITDAYNSANEQIVIDTFNTVLNRDPATEEGLDYWTTQLNTGAVSVNDIDDAIYNAGLENGETTIVDSSEMAVIDAFSDILGRLPEDAGLDYWASQVDNGAIKLDDLDEAIYNAAVANGEIPAMAEGGIVNGSTLTLLGEANYPEMVTPLKNPNDPLGSESILKELRAIKQVMENQEQRIYKLQVDNSKMRKIMEREELGVAV